jgi:YVTN family beta-propeller protein
MFHTLNVLKHKYSRPGFFRASLILLVALGIGLSACAPVASTSPTQPADTATVSGAGFGSGGSDMTATPLQAMPSAMPGATAMNTPTAAAAGPKAYIGLFKDNAVAVVDTSTGQILSKIPIPTGPHGLVITPDGRWVYASSDGDSKVSLIDTHTDQVTQSIEVGKTPHGLAITPDGKTVLVAVYGTSQVAFIDTATNQVTGQVAVPNPHNIAISPDGQTAYVAAQMPNATSLAVLNLANKTQVANIPLDKAPRALNFSPDGKQLYFTQAGVNAVQVLDPATNKVVNQIQVGASPHLPLFTSDGQVALIVAQGPGELDIADPKMGAVYNTAKVGTMPHWIALTPDGKTAWVTNEGSNDVSVVDIETGTVKVTIPVGNAPRKIVIQPAASSASQGGSVVAIASFAFGPKALTIKAGQAVTWTNNDTVTHSATADDKSWDSGDIAPGQSFSRTFQTAGTYTYHCSHHPYMTGTITVTA